MEPMASAIVCDDLRFEFTGKPIIIGVYPYDMVVQSFPVTLPQLTVITTLYSDIKEPIKKFTVVVDWPGGEFSQDFDLPETPVQTFPDATRFEATGAALIRPVQLKEPGIFMVRVRFEGGEVRARRIRLILQPAPTKQEPASSPGA